LKELGTLLRLHSDPGSVHNHLGSPLRDTQNYINGPHTPPYQILNLLKFLLSASERGE